MAYVLGGVEMRKRGQGSLPERDAGAGDGRDFRDTEEMQVLPGWKTLGLSFNLFKAVSESMPRPWKGEAYRMRTGGQSPS